MSVWALSLQRNEEAQCRWGAVGRIHSEIMKRNMNHCMWHSNKGPRLHSTSVCLYKSPMCRNYTCNVFFSGLKGFCCAALRGSPVFTVLWNHLQTLHLMGQSSGLTDPWSTRQMFSILLPAADYPTPSSGWLCHTQLNLSETGSPSRCFFSCWGPHVFHWYPPPLQGPSSSLSAGMILYIRDNKYSTRKLLGLIKTFPAKWQGIKLLVKPVASLHDNFKTTLHRKKKS